MWLFFIALLGRNQWGSGGSLLGGSSGIFWRTWKRNHKGKKEPSLHGKSRGVGKDGGITSGTKTVVEI